MKSIVNKGLHHFNLKIISTSSQQKYSVRTVDGMLEELTDVNILAAKIGIGVFSAILGICVMWMM